MKVSIIGTNGFLSNEIGQYCNAHHIDVYAYGIDVPKNHKYASFEQIDLTKQRLDAQKLAQTDVVIYTSGAGIQSNLKEPWDLIYKLNTLVPIEISCMLSEINFAGTFVTFGSYFEIGNNAQDRYFDESALSTSLLETPNHYCLSKRLLTRYVSSSFAPFKHLHIILPTIYGHGEARHRIIPYTVDAIKNQLPMQFTSGFQVRQYLYAGDIAQILMDLIAIQAKGIINMPGVETYSIRELVEVIYSYFGRTMDQGLFGKAVREDVGMQDLRLDGTLLDTLLPNIRYTPIKESLKFYE